MLRTASPPLFLYGNQHFPGYLKDPLEQEYRVRGIFDPRPAVKRSAIATRSRPRNSFLACTPPRQSPQMTNHQES